MVTDLQVAAFYVDAAEIGVHELMRVSLNSAVPASADVEDALLAAVQAGAFTGKRSGGGDAT